MRSEKIYRKRILACLLVLVMLFAMLPTTVLAATTDSIIAALQKEMAEREENAAPVDETGSIAVDLHIRSAEDFLDFATHCQTQRYSVGLTVSLDQDIDLSGMAFTPIPSFSGTFLGNGHTIQNYRCSASGSHQGLFRYVRNTGKIINLRVSGTVAPDGSRSAVGGIVGTNYGVVGNCRFSGTVTGLLSVGGIVGENFGIVKDCIMEGSVSAKHFSGGIVGYNEGSIGYCLNHAEINTEVFKDALNLSELDLNELVGLQNLQSLETDTVSDVGGIAGVSTGIIKACENDATIGYQHYAYNVGGIAGRQAGYLADCVNTGPVWGRKDVGGIVGQMAPYLILECEMSMGSELLALQGSTDQAVNNLDNNAVILGDSIADTSAYGVAISDNYYGTSGLLDAVESGETIHAEDYTKDTNKSAGNVVGDWFIEKGETAGETIEEYEEILGEDTIEHVTGNGDVTAEDISNITEASIKGGATLVGDVTNMITDAVDGKSGISSDAKRDQDITDAVQSARKTGDQLTSTMGQLSNDISGMNVHYGNILGMIANALTGKFEIMVLHDISDDDTDEMKDGKVEGCRNSGTVNADSNVGGIAGSMETEVDFDIEEILSTAKENEDISLTSSTYYCRDILTNCINDGSVIGKKENVGGVVGLNGLGNVLLSQNYGDISGSGNYYGGIVGKSESNIRKCFAMCALEGSSFIGGVTGQGKVIENCSTIVTADSSAACSGSIAGWVDFDDAESSLAQNYFVNETMGGVDGISYDGVCERVTYQELLTMKALPDEFRQLKLTFMVDGEEYKTITFTYGDTLDPDDIPAVPEKDGVVGIWSSFDTENMTRSQIVEAQYNARQTVVASEETLAGSPMSLAMVQGAFAQNTTLAIKDYNGGAALPRRAKEAKILTINGTNGTLFNYTVRWNTDGVSSRVYVLHNGVWEKVPCKMDGHYCVFTCSGAENTICVVNRLFSFLGKKG